MIVCFKKTIQVSEVHAYEHKQFSKILIDTPSKQNYKDFSYRNERLSSVKQELRY